MTEIAVACARADGGWVCSVDLRDADGSATRHTVTLGEGTLAALAPGAADPVDVVRRSFAFLLAREPQESILTDFDLMVIGRYFPDFEAEIGLTP